MCTGIIEPLVDWTLVVFASPQAELPSQLCPAPYVGCSPVLTEISYTQVQIHTFLRMEFGTRNDTLEAPCTVGGECSKMSLPANAPAATCETTSDGATACSYVACPGTSCFA